MSVKYAPVKWNRNKKIYDLFVAGGIAGERDTVLDVLDSRRFQEGRTVPEPQVI